MQELGTQEGLQTDEGKPIYYSIKVTNVITCCKHNWKLYGHYY